MNRSAKLFDFWARGEKGERVEQDHFTLKIFWKNLKKITEEYQIQSEYDDQKVVPTDDGLIDRIFLAGKELLLKTGVYCRNTERIIRFEPEEIDEGLNLISNTVVFGESADKVEIKHQGLDPDSPPAVLGRVLGPQSPEIIEKVFMSFAKEPIIDHFHFQGIFEEVNGVRVKPNSPWELLQELKRVGYARSVLRQVGRPGVHEGAMTPAGITGKIGCFSPELRKRDTDRLSTHILPHMMIDYDQMIVNFFSQMHGIPVASSGIAQVNGMAGSPPMTAVTIVAQMIAAVLLLPSSQHAATASDSNYPYASSREALWAGIHGAAAINSNTRFPYVKTVPGGIVTAGLGCEEHFWELAAATTGAAVVGCVVQGGTGRRSVEKDYSAGISARFAGEVGRAAIGIKRVKANELVNKFLLNYEDRLKNRTLHKTGMRFQDCYDLDQICPTDEHNKIYNGVKEKAVKMGLPL
jgi:methylamine--corrinoid protein Co-methyltransferase